MHIKVDKGRFQAVRSNFADVGKAVRDCQLVDARVLEQGRGTTDGRYDWTVLTAALHDQFKHCLKLYENAKLASRQTGYTPNKHFCSMWNLLREKKTEPNLRGLLGISTFFPDYGRPHTITVTLTWTPPQVL